MEITGLVFNILASLAGIAAIVIAVQAANRSAEGLVRERKLAYELDLLRDIGELLAEGGPDRTGWHSRLRVMLLTLPGNEDMPLVRAYTGARPTPEASVSLQQIADQVVDSDPLTYRGARQAQRARWVGLNRPKRLWETELEEAINKRLLTR